MQALPAELARHMLDAAPDATIVADADGRIQFANRQALALFGYSREELIGARLDQLVPERLRGRHAQHHRSYMSAPRLRPMGEGLELLGRRRDGSEFPVEISLAPIQDGGRTLVTAAVRDASERKRTETELRKARDAAEHARLTADHLREVADQARQSADRANQAKGRFLATASHDLRQPLQTIALLNGALRRMIDHPDTVEVLTQQDQAVGAMTRLLNALLDISKLDSGSVKPEVSDFKVSTLLEGLQREFATLAASKGLELQVRSSEDAVHSDAAMVEQILKNLVSNAVKYTPRGRVLLASRRQNGSIRIDVQDTGIGIPPDQIAYIYDEFYQVGVPTNSSRQGYGLGLSIVQRLVKLLDLRLEVMSEVGRGSVFSLVLPAAAADTLSADPRASSTSTSVRALRTGEARVLLVEDDPAVRAATRMLLQVEGYRVTAVASLSEALQCVQEDGPPDLVVTDYHLGDGELGTQVIALLRERLGAELKAILTTGDTSAAVRELPSDPHLRLANKPINAEELLGLLTGLLEA